MAESTQVRLARLEEKFDSVIKGQNKLVKLLEGNGKKGFIEETEDKFKDIYIKIAEYNGGRKMLTAILGTGFITGTVGFLLNKVF